MSVLRILAHAADRDANVCGSAATRTPAKIHQKRVVQLTRTARGEPGVMLVLLWA